MERDLDVFRNMLKDSEAEAVCWVKMIIENINLFVIL